MVDWMIITQSNQTTSKTSIKHITPSKPKSSNPTI